MAQSFQKLCNKMSPEAQKLSLENAWLEITGEIHRKKAKQCQDVLENLGACAVSLIDPGLDPVLEPLPGTTPLWENLKIVGLFEMPVDENELQVQLKQQCPHLSFQFSMLKDQDWSRLWLEHFHPQRFGERFWIIPTDYPDMPDLGPEPIVLNLDPGLAFGTGTEPSTSLCLNWLATNDLIGKQILDFGCGSGILGIAACLLGAAQVWAIDYDPQAITATRMNADRNEIAPAQLHTLLNNQPGSVPPVDVIVANILAHPLVELAPLLQACCHDQGMIVLSGILESQAKMVMAAYREWFTFAPVTVKEGWVLLVGTKRE